MAKPPRDKTVSEGSTYFVTAKSWEGRAIFRAGRIADLFIQTLFHYRAQGKYQLHEFVLMPDHFHTLLTLGEGVTLERAMQFIKGGFSHKAGQEFGRLEIWQRGYVDHRIRDAHDYLRHQEYLWSNPVRAHLADRPEDYSYSSARGKFDLDPIPQWLKPP